MGVSHARERVQRFLNTASVTTRTSMKMRSPVLRLFSFLFFVFPLGASETLEWRFKVFLDEKEIGYHNFEVEVSEQSKIMRTEAAFDVKVLFFNAFRYRHETTEEWEGDRLVRIVSTTDNNGDSFRVDGRLEGDHFLVSTLSDEFKLPERVMSFAYWKPRFLGESQLLNAQTGEYEQVSVSRRGVESLVLQGRVVPANRFDVVAKGKTISVWYAAEDERWLALETPVKGGRSLRYEPVVVPGSPEFLVALGEWREGDDS